MTVFPGLVSELTGVGADASFRRYFRVHLSNGEHYIVMDAPPQHEDCLPFIRVAELFAGAGVRVPRVLERDVAQGFLLLTDFGDTTYLSALNAETADALYLAAIDALVRIQAASRADMLPVYDRALLERELQLFPDWYLARHLGVEPDEGQLRRLHLVFARLLDNALTQSPVYVHRDYHSRNLMVVEDGPGILDFQDAVYGPITYDLVSLFKDAYIGWEEERVLDWTIRYWERARRAGLPVPADFAAFYRDFEWMGVQRHLKVLGIFSRLCHRDGKPGYLADMPRVLEHVRKTVLRYSELAPLAGLLDTWHGERVQDGLTF
ncbi:MAG: phosphotransferase [Betaproteobacteria bacterium]|nr:phosphotransferase [Betaproteobacteria bacterium]